MSDLQPPTFGILVEHVYVSTACLHGNCEHCQSTVGPDGPKAPGRCKWCAATCRCDRPNCHREST